MNKQRMTVSAIETPAVIVYMDVLESNIAEMSRLAGEEGRHAGVAPTRKKDACGRLSPTKEGTGGYRLLVGELRISEDRADAYDYFDRTGRSIRRQDDF